MRRDPNEFDPDQPALLVTYGNTTKKHRHLDNDVIVLGRANTSDFALVSPEVAQIHCVLVHVKEGWKLRDCSGRPGTRVNGKVIQEAVLLRHGDVIQVGAFIFQAHLPAGARPPAGVEPAVVQRLQRSRKRLGERALALRKVLAERQRAHDEALAKLTADRAELERKAEELRTQQKDFELRMTRLELSERDLSTDRATLEKEYRSLQEEVERQANAARLLREEKAQKERELETRQAGAQSELQQLWEEVQKRMGSAPAPAQNHVPVSALAPALAATADSPDLAKRARELELRAKELEHYAQHLKRLRQQLEGIPVPVAEMARLIGELRDLVDKTKEPRRKPRRAPRRPALDKTEAEISVPS